MGESRQSEHGRVVAYGSLYLDRGERMATVKEQLKALRTTQPVAFYFDVIYGPGQGSMADAYRHRVERAVRRVFPNIDVAVSALVAESPTADPRL